MKKEYILDGMITLLVMLFLYASFSKYFDFAEFQRAMHNQPFSDGFSTLLISLVPPAEILIAILLISEKTRLIGLWAAALTMTTFTLYILAVLLHVFPSVPCSCGGVIKDLSWHQHLVFNLFFLLLAILALRMQASKAEKLTKQKINHQDISRAKSG